MSCRGLRWIVSHMLNDLAWNDLAWNDRAGQPPCRTHDAGLWFADRPADIETAKLLCAQCPVRLACLEGALARSEPWGVWGGELFEHGLVIARKRPRGRPRKQVAEELRATA